MAPWHPGVDVQGVGKMFACSRPIVYIQTAVPVRHLRRQRQMIESNGQIERYSKVIFMPFNHHKGRKQDGCVLKKISNGTM